MDEKLKKMLEDGILTQEQYDSLIENSKDGQGNDSEMNESNDNDVEKLAKKMADKATAKLGKENARLKSELEKLKKQKLSAEELKAIEDSEKETALAEREKNIILAENKLFAVSELKEIGLDDGSKSSLDLISLVIDEDREAIKANIKAVDAIIKAKVKAEVDKVYKDNSHTPGKASGNGGVTNPYAKSTFNLTEQMKLEIENPELAKQLKALAK